MARGFLPDRLSRIARHLERYVDEGKLPGVLCLVSRGGPGAPRAALGLPPARARRTHHRGHLGTRRVRVAHPEALAHMAPEHTAEVRERRVAWIRKTRAAVQDRLTKEIAHWDARTNTLKRQEQTGKHGARLNSSEARRRADDLQTRLRERLAQLDREEHVSPLPPKVTGRRGDRSHRPRSRHARHRRPHAPIDTQASAARRGDGRRTRLGFYPVDREFDRLGHDIKSRDPATGKLRFPEGPRGRTPTASP